MLLYNYMDFVNENIVEIRNFLISKLPFLNSLHNIQKKKMNM